MLSSVFNMAVWVVFSISLTALMYSQLIYPLLMVLASRRRVTVPIPDEWPDVTLIIPAHNESMVIEAKIENALAIDYPEDKLQVIVASDGSHDDTIPKARAFENQGVKVLDLNPRRGKASVLNDAVAASSGEILCLCDANVMFRPDAIRRMVAHLSDASIGAVTGDVRLASEQSDFGEGESLFYKVERAIQLGESRIGSLVCVDGGMYVLRKEHFQSLRPDTVLDDFTTTMNVVMSGKRVVYEPAAIADENGTPSWKQEFRRRIRTTIGAVQSVRRGFRPSIRQPIVLTQYISHKLLRWLGPIWLIALFVSSCVLWNSGTTMQAFVIAQAGFYGLALLATISRSLRESSVGGIPFYFSMSHLAMLVGLVKSIRETTLGTWERTERQLPVTGTHSTEPAS
ncbi:MAG: glycosyltransferase family 2 protein [Planctomycetaceae bacterium]